MFRLALKGLRKVCLALARCLLGIVARFNFEAYFVLRPSTHSTYITTANKLKMLLAHDFYNVKNIQFQ